MKYFILKTVLILSAEKAQQQGQSKAVTPPQNVVSKHSLPPRGRKHTRRAGHLLKYQKARKMTKATRSRQRTQELHEEGSAATEWPFGCRLDKNCSGRNIYVDSSRGPGGGMMSRTDVGSGRPQVMRVHKGQGSRHAADPARGLALHTPTPSQPRTCRCAGFHVLYSPWFMVRDRVLGSTARGSS